MTAHSRPQLRPDPADSLITGRAQTHLNDLEFELPPALEATEPPEARGLTRDQVRLMVSTAEDDSVRHSVFTDLPSFLQPGDLVVVNTSGTLNAAIRCRTAGGKDLELHLSTRLPAGIWTVELRAPSGSITVPFHELGFGDVLALDGGGSATILAPYACGCNGRSVASLGRLWLATFDLAGPVEAYFNRNGFPIRYSYVRDSWPVAYYQTVFATEVGSAEMPSAGRAFTPELITRLVAAGVQVAPLLLHTGVASLESTEPPYEEFYRVPHATARAVTATRETGHRVIAVGTTVVRALETVTDETLRVHPGEGWTCHVVSPDRPIRSINALLTGFHEPRSSHLTLLEGLVPRSHLAVTYHAALAHGYLWHEFGDLHLILGGW